MANSLFVIIPLYNEELNVGNLVNSLKCLVDNISSEFLVQIIIIDDGSVDNTVAAIKTHCESLQNVILEHPVNRGPGTAFSTGFKYLNGRIGADDLVLTMEGDNTSNIDTIQHLLVRRKEGYDVVLASPYLYSGGFSHVSFIRVILSHLANTLVKIFTGIRGIVTFSCFLRLYSGATIIKLQKIYGPKIIQSKGFESMVELLAKLVFIKSSISEVEMIVNWNERAGKSKMKLLKTIFGYLWLFINWSKLLKPVNGYH
jgi:dolichol-phosphate mannosyltransferase